MVFVGSIFKSLSIMLIRKDFTKFYLYCETVLNSWIWYRDSWKFSWHYKSVISDEIVWLCIYVEINSLTWLRKIASRISEKFEFVRPNNCVDQYPTISFHMFRIQNYRNLRYHHVYRVIKNIIGPVTVFLCNYKRFNKLSRANILHDQN